MEMRRTLLNEEDALARSGPDRLSLFSYWGLVEPTQHLRWSVTSSSRESWFFLSRLDLRINEPSNIYPIITLHKTTFVTKVFNLEKVMIKICNKRVISFILVAFNANGESASKAPRPNHVYIGPDRILLTYFLYNNSKSFEVEFKHSSRFKFHNPSN